MTGHTGFKGSWLCTWLVNLGADVTGFALQPPSEPALFTDSGLATKLRHVVGDIRDPAAVTKIVMEVQPEIVFHLAAQPLVRESYRDPICTYETNVMGTAHLLEALRLMGNNPASALRACAVVVVTTDKCYENREWLLSYREEDSLGGADPYSSSKAAAEIVVSAYRRSYFSHPSSVVRLASARAGNVIGGGDWAQDRIVPDSIRALISHRAVPVRNANSRRPWQHVLEPLSGYLWLAACLIRPALAVHPTATASAFNFGPAPDSNRTVAELVSELLRHWPGSWENKSDATAVHEATLLSLSTDRAYQVLRWTPVWRFEETIKQTVLWYQNHAGPDHACYAYTSEQIESYVAAARQIGVLWAS